MSDALSPRIEQLVKQHVDGERFTSADEVMFVAMQLFDAFQRQNRRELEAALKAGFGQLDAGEGIELEDESELRAFFDDIKQRGRQRYDERRTA